MPTCDRCGTRLARHDENSKMIEYACATCHASEVIWKDTHRDTGNDTVAEGLASRASD